MIRAIIATINGDATTLEQSTDKDLIAKVIRQGGRRVWVDSADADGSERAWIAQTFDVPLAFLAIDVPTLENKPNTLMCFQVPIDKEGQSWLPIIIVAKTSILLTAHSARLTILDRVFSQAAQTKSYWQENTASLLSNIVQAAIEPIIAAQADMLRQLSELFAQPLSSEMLRTLFNLDSQFYFIQRKASDHSDLLYGLRTYPLIGEQDAFAWPLEQLADTLRSNNGLLISHTNSVGDRAALLASQQNAALIEQGRQLYSLLRVALPTIILLLIVLILVVLVRG